MKKIMTMMMKMKKTNDVSNGKYRRQLSSKVIDDLYGDIQRDAEIASKN